MRLARLFPAAAGCAAGMICLTVRATPVTITPDEDASKDAFIYQGIQGPNPPAFNSDTFANGAYIGFLSSGKPASPHSTASFIQFDLSGVTLDANEVARLNLYTVDTTQTGFGANPTPQFPVSADLHKITTAWGETTVTWPNQPAFDAGVSSTATVDGINKWITFDVTALVQSWLAAPASNLGVSIFQPTTVLDTNTGQEVVSMYESASGTHRPFLEIVAVPEPAAAGMLLLLSATCLKRRRDC